MERILLFYCELRWRTYQATVPYVTAVVNVPDCCSGWVTGSPDVRRGFSTSFLVNKLNRVFQEIPSR